MRRTSIQSSGLLFVAMGAALWGTDAVFRRGLALEMPSVLLVFLEHLVLVVVTGLLLWRGRSQVRRLKRADWIAAVVIGAGSSALATALFTSAFRYGDPTTPLLLQKVQPLVAILGARLLLGERLVPRFAWFVIAGITGAYLVAFPDPLVVSIGALTPALLALGAAVLWGVGTVLGRKLAVVLTFPVLTALRFAIGLPAAGILVLAGGAGLDEGLTGNAALGIVLLALVPGLLALLLYYRGLRSTSASAATIAELAFPLTAAGLNFLVFGTVLTASQWLGMLLLTATITLMTWLARSGEQRALGVVTDSQNVSPCRVAPRA